MWKICHFILDMRFEHQRPRKSLFMPIHDHAITKQPKSTPMVIGLGGQLWPGQIIIWSSLLQLKLPQDKEAMKLYLFWSILSPNTWIAKSQDCHLYNGRGIYIAMPINIPNLMPMARAGFSLLSYDDSTKSFIFLTNNCQPPLYGHGGLHVKWSHIY